MKTTHSKCSRRKLEIWGLICLQRGSSLTTFTSPGGVRRRRAASWLSSNLSANCTNTRTSGKASELTREDCRPNDQKRHCWHFKKYNATINSWEDRSTPEMVPAQLRPAFWPNLEWSYTSWQPLQVPRQVSLRIPKSRLKFEIHHYFHLYHRSGILRSFRAPTAGL